MGSYLLHNHHDTRDSIYSTPELCAAYGVLYSTAGGNMTCILLNSLTIMMQAVGHIAGSVADNVAAMVFTDGKLRCKETRHWAKHLVLTL